MIRKLMQQIAQNTQEEYDQWQEELIEEAANAYREHGTFSERLPTVILYAPEGQPEQALVDDNGEIAVFKNGIDAARHVATHLDPALVDDLYFANHVS